MKTRKMNNSFLGEESHANVEINVNGCLQMIWLILKGGYVTKFIR